MKFRATLLISVATLLVLGAAPSARAVGPYWDIKATWGDTNLPGSSNPLSRAGQFTLQARNVGDAPPDFKTPLVITDELPEGVTATQIHWDTRVDGLDVSHLCSGVGTGTVTCSTASASPSELTALTEAALPFPKGKIFDGGSGWLARIFIDVVVDLNVSQSGINTATVSGGGATQPFADVDRVPFSDTPSPFGVVDGSLLADNFTDAYPFGMPSRQAGDRPFELRVNFDLNQRTDVGPDDGTRYIDANGLLRTVEVTLPRGWLGNPEAVPKCDPILFGNQGSTGTSTACPANTQVGYLNVRLGNGPCNYGRKPHCGAAQPHTFSHVPIYNLEPPKGAPADVAFSILGIVQGHIYTSTDPAQGDALKAVTPNISAFGLFKARETQVTIWGVPGDPAHDRFRYDPKSGPGASFGSTPIRPFLTNPMDCGFDNGGARIRVDSYQKLGSFSPVQEYGDPLNVGGCDDPRIRFNPDISLQPTSRDAGGPTGLNVHLEVPQRNDVVGNASELYAQNGDVQAIATPPMKKAVVTMPEGMTISPSAAQGLGSCSSEQIGLGTNDPVRCPDNSQYGTLTLHTPILPENAPMKGFIYIAKQDDNPFQEFLALYLVIEDRDRGILVKVPGRVDLDPVTGQIKTTFDDLPQFPVSNMQMSLKGGVRAALVNPVTCGRKTIRAEFFSWHDPQTAQVVTDSYDVMQQPDGSPCVNHLAERSFSPGLSAGTLNPIAGTHSPFLFRLTRSDHEQEFSQLGATLPPGLSAKLAGVAECPEGGLAQAEAPGRRGSAEIASPSCPASSYIGSTDVGAGVGVPLTYVPGRVYLAGPYKGAPLSMAVITPAVVGPYDLGVIAVRTALRVNPETTQVSVASDPLPLIFKGIPVRIRDIRVKVDRQSFTLNPTNCAEMEIAAHVTGTGGDLSSTADDTTANLQDRFQAADCASLGFKPRLSLRLFGGVRRGAHPKFQAVLRARPGDANIGKVSVALPRSEFLDQGHIRTVCTRVQFDQGACPAGSIYGFAKATSPLLDAPLSGPVYLRSSSNMLPDLVAALKGKIDVNVVGRIDTFKGGIRSTFDVVPDAPVTQFTLTMQGGKKGLLVNSTNLCKRVNRATARFTAQNGKGLLLRPVMQNSCKKAKRQTNNRAQRARTD